MSDQNPSSFGSPQVQDKRLIPPGVLPKNMQGLALGGLAAVMIAVIALSGTNTPKPKPVTDPSAASIDPSAARIQEYQKRIEEQTRKLQLEQSQLRQTQETSGIARGASGGTPPLSNPRFGSGIYGDTGSRGYSVREATGGDTWIQTEREKREYQSLFASNLALSYRQESAPVPLPPSSLSLDEVTRILSLNAAMATLPTATALAAGPAAGSPSIQTPTSSTLTEPFRKAENALIPEARHNPAEQSAKNAARQGIAEDPSGSYRVFEGTVLETALTNRLDGSFSGPINCMVTTNLYSRDGRHLLVPQGSRVLGEVQKVESFGQERLAVFFHRLLMPDGYSVDLDQFQGLNQIGETGLRDQVNHHYLQVFAASMAIGAIAGLGQASAGTGIDRTALDNYEQGVTTSLSESSLRILDRYLNVLPTFTIREGLRVKIYLSQDLLLPAYDMHRPGNR